MLYKRHSIDKCHLVSMFIQGRAALGFECVHWVLWVLWSLSSRLARQESTLGQNATFFRGTLEKMPSKDLQNCPRNVERSSSSEDSFGGPRTASFPESQGKRWHFNIIPWLCRFSSDQIQNDVIFQLFPPEISVTLR